MMNSLSNVPHVESEVTGKPSSMTRSLVGTVVSGVVGVAESSVNQEVVHGEHILLMNVLGLEAKAGHCYP